jgi:hypothetical protein
MTDERRYTILLDPDDEEGGHTVTVLTLPAIVTQGETVEQCLERARERRLPFTSRAWLPGACPSLRSCALALRTTRLQHARSTPLRSKGRQHRLGPPPSNSKGLVARFKLDEAAVTTGGRRATLLDHELDGHLVPGVLDAPIGR